MHARHSCTLELQFGHTYCQRHCIFHENPLLTSDGSVNQKWHTTTVTKKGRQRLNKVQTNTKHETKVRACVFAYFCEFLLAPGTVTVNSILICFTKARSNYHQYEPRDKMHGWYTLCKQSAVAKESKDGKCTGLLQ